MGILGSLGVGYALNQVLGGGRGRRGYGRSRYGGGYGRRGYGRGRTQVRGGCCCLPIPLLALGSTAAAASALRRLRR